MTRYELSLSTADTPAGTVETAEWQIGRLVADHLAAGYAPADLVTIGRTRDGEYIAYATIVKTTGEPSPDPTTTSQEISK